MKLILASNSKQRYNLLKMIGWKFEVVPSIVEEKSQKTDPKEYVIELSKKKADSVKSQIKQQAIIIASDSIVYMNGKKYEKPKNKEEAFNNIKEMSGKLTYAITGVTVKDLYKNKTISFADIAEVYLKEINDNDIRWYIENEENILKSSGYVIPGKAALFIDKIVGDYNSVVGLSISKLHSTLKELGYSMSDFEYEK